MPDRASSKIRAGHPVLTVVKKTFLGHPAVSAGMVLAILASAVVAVLPPLVLQTVVNGLVDRHALLFGSAVLYFVLIAFSGVIDAGKEVLITVFGQKTTHGIRSAMTEKLSRLPSSYYADHEAGITASLFVNDVDAVDQMFASGIVSMFSDAAKVISILVSVFLLSPGLGVLLLIALPLLFWMTRVFQKRMLAAQIENRAAIGRANQHLPETLRNRRTIRVFRAFRYMRERYETFLDRSFAALARSNFYDAVYSPIVITVSAVLVAVMMILSVSGTGVQTFFGMSVGTVVALISYVGKIFDPLENIGMEIQGIQSAVAGVRRIGDFLREEEPERPAPSAEAAQTSPAEAVIDVKGVSFSYDGKRDVLRDLSLEVNEGEMVTLIGRTGAGKSTLFRLLTGLYPPSAGTVRLAGKDPMALPDDERRRLIGYVEQQFRPVVGTIRDQITLKDSRITEDAVARALELVGLSEVCGNLPKGLDTPYAPALLSQGQWQLLSIARAIALEPEILLFDEITANLDSHTEAAVLKALQNAAEGRTILSISHRLYETSGGRTVTIPALDDKGNQDNE